MERSAGVIMHIASLPGKFGIGTFGKEAYEYVEFLFKSGLKYWQILPLGQTGYGDSPYQSFSAFAGNPYFIDFDILNKEGILNKEDYVNENYGQEAGDSILQELAALIRSESHVVEACRMYSDYFIAVVVLTR